MALKSMLTEIVESLEDLSNDNLEKFREYLISLRVAPRVRRATVEGKTRAGLASVLISTFMEVGAVKVTVEILRKIGCYQEAKELESRTQIHVNGDPIFRRTLDGRLDLSPSEAALELIRTPGNIENFPELSDNASPEEVEARAKVCVVAKGLDPYDWRSLLSQFVLLTKQYRFQTFKWVLENDMNYVVEIVAHHQIEKEELFKDQTSLMANKDALAQYAMAYPEVAELIRLCCQRIKKEDASSRTANHQLHPHYIQQQTNGTGL